MVYGIIISMTTSGEVTVSPFAGDENTMATIAALHLQLRHWQIDQGQAKFLRGILDSQPDLTTIDKSYIKPGGNFFVARSSNEIVGFVGMRKESDEEARLKRLAVMPNHQRRGIGSLLVGATVEWATRVGFQKITLATGLYENAKPLYENFGFVVVEVDQDHEDYLMELDLKSGLQPEVL